jgi:hypothetical protein
VSNVVWKKEHLVPAGYRTPVAETGRTILWVRAMQRNKQVEQNKEKGEKTMRNWSWSRNRRR